MSNSLVLNLRFKVLICSADLQLYDSEFQTEGVLMLKAFDDNTCTIQGSESSSLSDDRCVHAAATLTTPLAVCRECSAL